MNGETMGNGRTVVFDPDGAREASVAIGVCGGCGQLGPAAEKCRRVECLDHQWGHSDSERRTECRICRAYMAGEYPGALGVLFARLGYKTAVIL